MTLVPEQILVALALTTTDGVTEVLTVIATGVEMAVVGDAQDSDEVITHVIISPLLSAAFVYVALFGPTLDPLSNH